MRCVKSYQDIKTPDKEQEEREFESILESMLEEYDPEEAGNCSFQQYKENCIRQLNRSWNRS